MKFRYYFFKEQNRTYDLADLLAYFEAGNYMVVTKIGDERKINYHHPELKFEAAFIISTKSTLSNLHLLDPKYLDLNIRLEFDILLSTYKVGLLVDIVEGICKRFNFSVYNELFENVFPYKRSMLLKAFDLGKQLYKEKYEEEFIKYYKIEQQSLDSIYSFIEQRKKIESYYSSENLKALDYIFYKEEGYRKAYVGAIWDGISPFILPPSIALIIIRNEEGDNIISYKEFSKKIGKLLKQADGNLLNIYIANNKDIKKIKRIINKTKFNQMYVPLKEIPLNSILDI